jgi:hypothetical protein
MSIKSQELDISGLNFPQIDLAPGRLFYKTDIKTLYAYDGVTWTAAGAGTLQKVNVVPTGSINGSNLTYTLPDVFAAGQLIVSRDGLVMQNGVDFFEQPSLPGFTMTPAPLTGSSLLAFYPITTNIVFPTQSSQSFVATASQTVFNLNFSYLVGSGALQVYSGGLRLLIGVDYVETNSTTVTFFTGRTLGENVIFIAQGVQPNFAHAATHSPTGSDPLPAAVTYREDYVVGTALNNYTGSTTVFNLANSYVAGNNTLTVTVDGQVQTKGATVDYQETSSLIVTFNNALIAGQKVSFIFTKSSLAPIPGVYAHAPYVQKLRISNISAVGNHVLWWWAAMFDTLGNVFVSNAPGSIVTTNITNIGVVNGLDVGSVAINTWYYVWLISNGTNTGALYSLSQTAPTLPTGYIYKLLLGAVRTDGSGNIIETLQVDDTVYYSLDQLVLTDTTHDNTSIDVDISSRIPPLIAWQAYIFATLTATYSVAGTRTVILYAGGEFGGVSPGSGAPTLMANSSIYQNADVIRTSGTKWIPIFNESAPECIYRAKYFSTATNRTNYEYDAWVLGYKLSIF